MALSRSRRHLGVFRLVPLFLLLVSTMVAAQNTPVESTVLLVTTELNTATAGMSVSSPRLFHLTINSQAIPLRS